MYMKCTLIKIKFDIDINMKTLKKFKQLIITNSAQQCRAQMFCATNDYDSDSKN